MDTSIIQKQYEQPTEYPSSIALQNHIYGCFILMEDIAQGTITYDGTLIKTLSKDGAHYVFPIDQAFTQIGIRYGFLFDTKLILEDCLPEYKKLWLSIFKTLSVSKKIEEVDTIEDEVITWIQKTIVTEDAYFIHALETGILPQAWIGKVVGLLLPALSQALSEKPVVKHTVAPLAAESVVPLAVPSVVPLVVPSAESVVPSVIPSVIPSAESAVPSVIPSVIHSAKARHFARTRRNHSVQPMIKKNFGQTRRSSGIHSTNKANTIIHIQ